MRGPFVGLLPSTEQSLSLFSRGKLNLRQQQLKERPPGEAASIRLQLLSGEQLVALGLSMVRNTWALVGCAVCCDGSKLTTRNGVIVDGTEWLREKGAVCYPHPTAVFLNHTILTTVPRLHCRCLGPTRIARKLKYSVQL